MIRQAVILIPGVGQEPPAYLFSPVAGVPFLPRQILGLRRAGIADITILAPPNLQEPLTRELARQQYLFPGIQINSGWPDYLAPQSMETGSGYFLTLLVNTLIDPQALQAFFQRLPPPGALSLGVVNQPQQTCPSEVKPSKNELNAPPQ